MLTTYGISQNKLATAMGLQRSAVYKWVHEERDPTALTVVGIVKALRGMKSEAAEAFIKLYLGEPKENQDPESKETRFFAKTLHRKKPGFSQKPGF